MASNEINISLTEKQTLFDETVAKTRNTFYGGARGGGKSHGVRVIMVKRRFQYPGTKGVIFRKTYTEIRDNHIDPLLEAFPILNKWYVATKKQIEFPNGSVLMFRYCEKEKDLKKYQGQEFHDMAIEEVGDWPEDWFWFLKASNRCPIEGVEPRCILAGNPGGIGHKWLKRLFIQRRFKPNERPNDYAFVPALVYDNPAIMENNPEYVDTLKSMGNDLLRKAWLEGSWDIMAGQYYDMVSRETHLVEPFKIPDYWYRFAGFDYGFNHPLAFGWFASDTDGNVYLYRELVQAGLRPEEFVQKILEHEDTKKLETIETGWDCWAKHGTGPSVEEKVSESSGNEIILTKANIDRVLGWQHLRDYLAVGENGPRLKIFNTCHHTFDCLMRLTHDDKNPEDVKKVDSDKGDPDTGDDPADMLRMALMSRPQISIEPPKVEKRRRYYREEEDEDLDGWTSV